RALSNTVVFWEAINYGLESLLLTPSGVVMRSVFAILSLLCLAAAVCPCDDSAAQPKVAIPESGFISPHQYTNAFFGFSLSIPNGCHFQIFDQSESGKPLEHFLFGEKCPEKGLTSFGIAATPLLGNAEDTAQRAVLLPT